MLKQKDLQWNIAAYTILSTLNILPFQVSQTCDTTSKTMSTKLKEQKSSSRLCIQRIWSVLYGLELIICVVNLLRLMMYPADTDKSHHFPFLLVSFCSFTLAFVGNISISYQWSDLNAEITQQIFRGLETDNSSDRRTTLETDLSPITKLFIMYLPLALLSIELAVIVLFIYDPHVPTTMYTILHHTLFFDGKKWAIIKWTCLVLHCVLLVPFLSTVYHALFLTLSFIHYLSFQMTDIMNNIMGCSRNSAGNSWGTHQILEKTCKQIRSLQLLTNYFNLCFSTVIFLFKVGMMNAAVLFGYLAIYYAHSVPIIALVNLLLAVDINAMFVLVVDKAFVIPEKSNELNRQLKSLKGSLYRKYTRDLVGAEVKSLRIPGIKVGQFRTLERESTPNFVNFVITQIVALLVM